MRPKQRFQWHHFGEGPQKRALEELAQTVLPENVLSQFHGYPSQEYLMTQYRDVSTDVFINVSQSEGTPVAVMEAVSCGFPVIATAVGGNPEIVSEKNGILLSPNPSPEEIANAIRQVMDDPAAANAKREGSLAVWRERYNADRNYRAFAERLILTGREKASRYASTENRP